MHCFPLITAVDGCLFRDKNTCSRGWLLLLALFVHSKLCIMKQGKSSNNPRRTGAEDQRDQRPVPPVPASSGREGQAPSEQEAARPPRQDRERKSRGNDREYPLL